MTFGEFIFIIAVGCVPLWLALRTWNRYAEIHRAGVAEQSQMLVGLALVTLTTAMWLAAFGLIILQDHSSLMKRIAVNVSPGLVGVANLPLCIGAFICSQLRKSSAQQTVPLRKALASSSGFLTLLWLLLTLNPH